MKSISSPLRVATTAVAAFLASLFAAATLPAADVSFYSVSKGIQFAQPNSSPPQIRTGYPFLFQAMAVPMSNALSSASVVVAFGSLPLGPRFAGGPFTYTDRQPTLNLLDLFYPNASFTVTLNTLHDGAHSGAVTITGDDYPNPPSVSNYAPAQSINSSNDFSLRWSGFTGATTNDFIFVQVDAGTGIVFRTSYTLGASGALSGTNTSLLIPSNTLAPGRAYVGRIRFVKIVETNTTAYPGVIGAGTYFTQTDFFLATDGAGDAVPPHIVSVSPSPGATNVPVNSPVIVTFDEPMRSALSLFVSGAGSLAGSSLVWSPDGFTFVAQPASKWPANTTLGFVLNPSDGQLLFGDANRNPLAMETFFQFTTGTNSVPPATPALTDPKRIVTGRFQFKLVGETNRVYAAEASTNLVNWVSLGTNTAWGGSIQFIDTNAPTLPRRFYRGFAP